MPRDYFKATIEYRLLQEFGDRLPEVLRDLYEVRGLPLREVMRELGVNNIAGTSRLLEKYGVRLRRGSEAVAHQWKRNSARKDGPGAKRFAQMVRGRAARGEHWANGHTKNTHPGLSRIANKLVDSGRLTRPDVIARATKTRRRLFRDNPERHRQGSAAPYPAETAFMKWLSQTGRDFVFQHPVVIGDNLLFIDFYLPKSRLGIEVSKSRQRFSLSRARLIASAGITPIGVPNSTALSGALGHVEKAIARAERGEFNPSTLRECWMVRRAYTYRAADASDLDQPIR